MTRSEFLALLDRLAAGWVAGDAAAVAAEFADEVRYGDPTRYRFRRRSELVPFFDPPPGGHSVVWHRWLFDEAAQAGVAEYTYVGHRRYHGAALVEIDGHDKIADWREWQHLRARLGPLRGGAGARVCAAGAQSDFGTVGLIDGLPGRLPPAEEEHQQHVTSQDRLDEGVPGDGAADEPRDLLDKHDAGKDDPQNPGPGSASPHANPADQPSEPERRENDPCDGDNRTESRPFASRPTSHGPRQHPECEESRTEHHGQQTGHDHDGSGDPDRGTLARHQPRAPLAATTLRVSRSVARASR